MAQSSQLLLIKCIPISKAKDLGLLKRLFTGTKCQMEEIGKFSHFLQDEEAFLIIAINIK